VVWYNTGRCTGSDLAIICYEQIIEKLLQEKAVEATNMGKKRKRVTRAENEQVNAVTSRKRPQSGIGHSDREFPAVFGRKLLEIDLGMCFS
jgi:hypothetical protein